MATFISNVRAAFRDLTNRPTFAATVVVTLALGIGATTTAFALVNAVFLTRLPVRDQDRLVEIWGTTPARFAGMDQPWPVPWAMRARLADRSGTFAGVTAFRSGEPYSYAALDGDRTVHVAKTSVAGNFFDVLGVKPVLGRLLRASDDVTGAPDVAVLSDELWRTGFGGDRHVIGRLIFFAGASRRVIGVAPPQFSFPAGTSVWLPVVAETYARWKQIPDDFPFYLVGRLRDGIQPSRARIELAAALRAYTPSANYTLTMGVLPTGAVTARYVDMVLGHDVRAGVLVVFGAVLLVLVIACTNIAGLLIARGISRSTGLAVRAALGASRRRLINYLLTEAALLAIGGGLVGLAVGWGLVWAAVHLAPPDLPMIGTAHLDVPVVAFAVAITVASVIGFGLPPAFRASRPDSHGVLRGGTRSVTGGRSVRRARRALVGAQVALAVVVLVGAALLGSSLFELQRVPLGFEADHLLFFRLDYMVSSAASRDSAFDRRAAAMPELLADRLPATPGLGKVTTVLSLPFSGTAAKAHYVVDGQMPPDGHFTITDIDYALADYFDVMDIPLLQGRTFTRQDNQYHGAPVVIVSEGLAHAAWPGRDAIGHQMRFLADTAGKWFTVVGVVGDARFDDLVARPAPRVYMPPAQATSGDPWLVVRTSGKSSDAVRVLERTIQATDRDFGVSRSTTGAELLAARLARPRALAALFGALATTALLLAAIGLFGVLSAYVRERRREMAIRSAIGASPAQLRSLVLGESVSAAIAGLAVGVPLAMAASKILRALVSDVQAPDTLTMLVVALPLLTAAAAATYGPMVRAARVDARTALASD